MCMRERESEGEREREREEPWGGGNPPLTSGSPCHRSRHTRTSYAETTAAPWLCTLRRVDRRNAGIIQTGASLG